MTGVITELTDVGNAKHGEKSTEVRFCPMCNFKWRGDAIIMDDRKIIRHLHRSFDSVEPKFWRKIGSR